ncbi:MAG: phosphoribosylaminoimidazolesuccinocarboxamide synthase [Candidatus Aenigmarchaeota archaeon]|nr:phosphoribosylaminoimidazolesuccinocarboxamide synthase [Candidatus Aenigmarchaeota archaeon]
MGSVKDISVLRQPTHENLGSGIFTFSDSYSVFDWGRMPDQIPGKGAALCMMSAYYFEPLARAGWQTHYNGLAVDGEYANLADLDRPCNQMGVWLLNVLKPVKRKPCDADEEKDAHSATVGDGENRAVYDYSAFQLLPRITLVPMEFIYRNSLPLGSSVFKRLGSGQLTPAEMGLDAMPREGDQLPKPFLDLSSKFEQSDRYMSWKEAERLAGLHPGESEKIRDYMSMANRLISEATAPLGLANEDGKFEFGFGDFAQDGTRSIMLVDALGTLDECRFTYKRDGTTIPVSKEVARRFYRREQPEWVAATERAKKEHPGDWRDHVGIEPVPLPAEFRDMIGLMYQSVANEILGRRRRLFEAPPLEEVMDYFARQAVA